MPPEFSRPLVLGHVPPAGRKLQLEASPEERVALAARLGIEEVRDLRASLRLLPEVDGPVRVTGRLDARVVQLCVVSLEPVEERIGTTVSLRLLPAGRPATDSPEDSVDEIESGGMVDLGDLLAEELALALDPYPRHPDATLPPEASGDEASPFARLAALKPRKPDA